MNKPASRRSRVISVSRLRLNNEAGYVVSQQNNLMLPARFAPMTR